MQLHTVRCDPPVTYARGHGRKIPRMAFADPEHELSPQQVSELLKSGEIELIDVREPHEWDAGRIAGARHIELERLAGRAEEVPHDRKIVFQCRLGVRSAMA